MKKLWVLSSLLCLAVILAVACARPATTTAPTAKPSPTATATKPTASPSPTTTATTKPTATATSAPVSFAGKTITIVVPYAAGGGTDIFARVYARYLPNFLPGKPNVVVRNIPGAEGTIGSNMAYSSKPDGVTVLASSVSVHIAQLVSMSAVKYDLLKMVPIISTPAGALFYIRPGFVTSPEDIVKAKGLVFGTGPGLSAGSVLFVIAKELMNIPVDKVVLAYTGVGEVRRAFLSGELNFSYETSGGLQDALQVYVDKGEAQLLFQTGIVDPNGKIVRDSNLPPIPTVLEIYQTVTGKEPTGLAWDAYKAVVMAGLNTNRTLFLPPGTPQNIVQTYWDAAARMIKDPDFTKVVAPMVGKGALWQTGEALDKSVKNNFGMKPEVSQWVRDAMRKYQVVVE